MADQDFDINIRINADTAQVEAIRQSFQRLGAQVEVTNRQAAAATGGAGGDAGIIGSLAGRVTGVSLAGSLYAFVDGLKKASAEIAKTAEDLDKQGAQLLKNAQLMEVQAKHATSADDVIKISEKTLKDIETTQKTVTDLTQKELGYSELISDELQKQMLSRQRAAGIGDYEAARRQNIDTAESQNQQARKRAISEIDEALKAQHRSLEQIISDLEKSVATEQKRAAQAKQNNDAPEYARAINALETYNSELEKNLKLREKQHEQQGAKLQKTTGAAEEDFQHKYNVAGQKAQLILTNEEDARRARAAGNYRTGDLYQQSADALKRSATPAERANYEILKATLEQTRVLEQMLNQWK